MFDLTPANASRALNRPISLKELEAAKFPNDEPLSPVGDDLKAYWQQRGRMRLCREILKDGSPDTSQIYVEHIGIYPREEVPRFQRLVLGDSPSFERTLEGHGDFLYPPYRFEGIEKFPELNATRVIFLEWDHVSQDPERYAV